VQGKLTGSIFLFRVFNFEIAEISHYRRIWISTKTIECPGCNNPVEWHHFAEAVQCQLCYLEFIVGRQGIIPVSNSHSIRCPNCEREFQIDHFGPVECLCSALFTVDKWGTTSSSFTLMKIPKKISREEPNSHKTPTSGELEPLELSTPGQQITGRLCPACLGLLETSGAMAICISCHGEFEIDEYGHLVDTKLVDTKTDSGKKKSRTGVKVATVECPECLSSQSAKPGWRRCPNCSTQFKILKDGRIQGSRANQGSEEVQITNSKFERELKQTRETIHCLFCKARLTAIGGEATCHQCSTVFEVFEVVDGVVAEIGRPTDEICPHCNMNLKQLVNENYFCRKCDAMFVGMDDTITEIFFLDCKHCGILTHTMILDEQFGCHDCSGMLILQKNMAVVRIDDSVHDEEIEEEIGEEDHYCPRCDFILKTTEERWECSECEWRFRVNDDGNLKKLGIESEYECPVCEEYTIRLSDDETYNCPKCQRGYVLDTDNDLEVIAETRIRCPECKNYLADSSEDHYYLCSECLKLYLLMVDDSLEETTFP